MTSAHTDRSDSGLQKHEPAFAGHRRKVLLVDDDAMLLRAVEGGLATMGFAVVAAEGPRTALDILRASTGEFGVVVTDFSMPGMSGLELASAVRGLDPRIRIVLHAATPPASSADVDQVVEKPACLSELASAVAALLNPQST
ncbi:MAG: response regulator [Polyangiaceae bacterium]|nr:response regulator [Polyangiaceae bacterium]